MAYVHGVCLCHIMRFECFYFEISDLKWINCYVNLIKVNLEHKILC